jgi:hypothetical protein
MWWDTARLAWSSAGCTLANVTDTALVCACTHLTEFAGRYATLPQANNNLFAGESVQPAPTPTLPTFSPLDDWEEFLDEDGVPVRPLDSYAFFYVNVRRRPERPGNGRPVLPVLRSSIVLPWGRGLHAPPRDHHH